MSKFRKKIIIVDAVQYEPNKGLEDGIEKINGHIMKNGEGIPTPYIDNASGRQYINQGDWIVTNEKGERFVSRKEYFEETYEPI